MAACGGIRALPVTRPGTGSFVAERDAAPLELCASRPQAPPAAAQVQFLNSLLECPKTRRPPLRIGFFAACENADATLDVALAGSTSTAIRTALGTN
jgi:hypothetical protein